ncbi:MAG TPA: aconitase/3-isopropylmalate dehydratase large subunit family protein [Methanomicrobiales archaeon]|nr:aconitase/3-isopropylmalate dehydratase large subunit family protein [Methanomicrobiales archaeon]
MATLSERILGGPAGTYVDVKVDRAFAHDGTGVLTREAFCEMGCESVRNPERTYLFFDHIAPANNSTTATLQAELRAFAKARGLHFSEIGKGICHQLLAEGIVLPGEVVVGADSHTCTLGAFGAFATGVGATDMAAIWASGATWFRVPETIAIRISGKFTGAAEPKDLALAYVRDLGMDGANYRALEFIGDGVAGVPMDGRLTCSNMAVEAGAKAGLFYADEVTTGYLAGFGQEAEPQAHEECMYAKEMEIDLAGLPPLIASHHRVDRVQEVSALAGTHLDEVFVGTCTNGRLGDLERLARILRGKEVRVRTIVVPASQQTLREATRRGIVETLLAAGCVVGIPGCGPCLGAHMGVLGEGEVCLSTANRNFTNRMGVGGEILLSSVATAGVSALHGVVTVPEAGDVR